MYMTSGIQNQIAESKAFSKFVWDSLKRFRHKDWGELDEEDKKMNDEAIESGERIVASYKFEATKEDNAQKIYIIMEYGHTITTILFPSEY